MQAAEIKLKAKVGKTKTTAKKPVAKSAATKKTTAETEKTE